MHIVMLHLHLIQFLVIHLAAPSGSEPDTPVDEAMITSEKTLLVKATGEKIIEEKKKVEIDVSVKSKKVHKTVVEGNCLFCHT